MITFKHLMHELLAKFCHVTCLNSRIFSELVNYFQGPFKIELALVHQTRHPFYEQRRLLRTIVFTCLLLFQ